MAILASNSIDWVRSHRAPGGGVLVSTGGGTAYPEVTGYLVPSLLARGETGLAEEFIEWLCSVQRADGSFGDPHNTGPFSFDTGQVARGFVAALAAGVHDEQKCAAALRRACNWLISHSTSEGRLACPLDSAWSMGARGTIPEAVHVYVLPALAQAGEVLDERRYVEFALRSRDWYIAQGNLVDFTLPNMLSHFFCYIQEALIDLDAADIATVGMASLAEHQRPNFAVPAHHDVKWICTPGQIQAAVCWFKLGDRERGGRTLDFIEQFRNPSGGYFGSYGVGAEYFPAEEISWATKFRLDATWLQDIPPTAHRVGPRPVREGKSLDTNLSAGEWHDSIAGGVDPREIAARVRAGSFPRWVRPVLEETKSGESLLELGSGTGELSAAIASAGRRTSLLDFSPESLTLARRVFETLNLVGDFHAADVLEALPFAENSHDCVWSSGLLEHFPDDQIAHILRESARVARSKVISLVPNARSIPYRVGKFLQERAGRWVWGKEDPKLSLVSEFEAAGLVDVREWTIAADHAVDFLSGTEAEGLKTVFTDWYESLTGSALDALGQGYLLVTVGVPRRMEAGAGPLRRLAVVPNDPLQGYVDAGYPDLTSYFNPEGYFDEVYCLSPHEAREQEMYGMKVIPTRRHEMRARVESLGIDVVRAYCLPMGLLACADKVPSVPYIVSVHDPNPSRCPGVLPDADQFLAVSGRIEDFLVEKGASAGVVQRLPNRVDLEVFRPLDDPGLRAEFENRFPGRFRVLHVGRKSVEKNLETTIEALALLGSDYVAIFVGSGDSRDYKALAKRRGVATQCHFVDVVPNEELPAFYSFADCMCTPSLWEGFGVVFIEALACGAVVVTTDIAPMSEYITHGQTGLLVGDPKDPVEVSDQIRRACEDRELAACIRRQARGAALPYSKEAVDAAEAEMYRLAQGSPEVALSPRSSPMRGDFKLHLLTEDLRGAWDEVVAQSRDAGMFHWSDWQELSRETWRCQDFSYMVELGGRVVAVCPLQRWEGLPNRLRSSNMGTGGPALLDGLDPDERERTLEYAFGALRLFLEGENIEEIELALPPLAPNNRKIWTGGVNPLVRFGFDDASTRTSVVDLSRDLEVIRRGFRKGHRYCLTKAQRLPIKVVMVEGLEDVEAYYKLHDETYRRSGIPPHPKHYFAGIHRYMIRRGKARMFLARLEGRVIAGACVGHFGDSAWYWTGAYSAEANETGAGRLLQWEIIKWAKSEGLSHYETGEVFPEAEKGSKLAGLTDFKLGFGGDICPYYKGVLRRGPR